MSQDDPGRAELEQIRRSMAELDQRLLNVERSLLLRPPPVPQAAPRPVRKDQPVAPRPPSRPSPIPVLPAEPTVAPKDRRSLETMIGLNWAGWVGAIVLVVGVLFGLKYAWDQGWIRPTPTMRVTSAIAMGLVLIGLGQHMHRRKARVVSATLHGAGLAIVTASFFAAYAAFQPPERVLQVTGALVGVVITAALGIVLSLQINAISLAVLALLGAYLGPFILNTGEDRSAAFLAYIGVLWATAWVLSAVKVRWVPLRVFAWAGTFVSYMLWCNSPMRQEHTTLATVWLVVFYFGFLAEMVLATSIQNLAKPQAAIETTTAILSLLNTAAAFVAMRVIYESPEHDPMLGMVAAALGALHGAIAYVSPSRGFAISSLLQCAALITLAVPLLLDRYAVTLAWMALAAALAGVAWELNLPAARAWAIVLLLIAIGRLFFEGQARNDDIFVIGPHTVSRWTLMAWGAAILGHLIGWLRPGAPGRYPSIERRFATILPAIEFARPAASRVLDYAAPARAIDVRGMDPAGIFISIVGTLLFCTGALLDFDGPAATLVLILWPAAIIALAAGAKSLGYLRHGSIMALLLSVKWLVADGLAPLADTWTNPTARVMPVVNLVALCGAGLCGIVLVWLVRCRQDEDQPSATPIAAGAWIGLLLLATLSFEACRMVDYLAASGAASIADPAIVKQVVLSVLWALVGFTTVIVGFARGIAALRWSALALLGVTLVKILLLDMAEVQAIWRILSFVAVGALLMGVSYVYHKNAQARRLAS